MSEFIQSGKACPEQPNQKHVSIVVAIYEVESALNELDIVLTRIKDGKKTVECAQKTARDPQSYSLNEVLGTTPKELLDRAARLRELTSQLTTLLF
jgi:hypothetical protein